MIRSATPSVREEFAGVKWTDNVRPVDSRTQRRVLDTFHQEQRVRPRKIKPERYDVENVSNVALYVLQLFATGKSTGAVAEACGCHRMQIVRFRNWVKECHGIEVCEVRRLTDATLDGIREFLEGVRGGAL